MDFQIEFKPRALKDLNSISRDLAGQILLKVEALEDNMAGDVKRLSRHFPEYRLRVVDYRVLFEIEADRIVIYRIKHRREAYR